MGITGDSEPLYVNAGLHFYAVFHLSCLVFNGRGFENNNRILETESVEVNNKKVF